MPYISIFLTRRIRSSGRRYPRWFVVTLQGESYRIKTTLFFCENRIRNTRCRWPTALPTTSRSHTHVSCTIRVVCHYSVQVIIYFNITEKRKLPLSSSCYAGTGRWQYNTSAVLTLFSLYAVKRTNAYKSSVKWQHSFRKVTTLFQVRQ